MSLVIASTTDTQEAVNAAAGIGPPQPKPSEAPAQGEPEAPQEAEPAEPDPDQEEQDDPEDSSHKKRRWGAQERISRLTREKYQYQARTQELERRLAELSAPRPQERPSPAQPQQQYTGEPTESQFERYEDYVRALSQYHAAAAYQQMRQVEMQRQAQYQREQQHTVWQDRVAQFRETVPDFDSVLEDAEHIQLSPVLQQTLLEHEDGARLAYELAKDQKTLERISRLSHTAAVRELGKFEAKLLNGEQSKPPAVSKAPPPISPVGQGSTRSTKSVDDMDYDEYKRWWAKTHPGKR